MTDDLGGHYVSRSAVEFLPQAVSFPVDDVQHLVPWARVQQITQVLPS